MKHAYRSMLLCAVACLLLAGCTMGGVMGGQQPPTPTPDSAEIIRQVVAATQQTRSVHFVIDFEGLPVYADPDRNFAILGVEGDLQRPDAALAIIRVRSVGSIAEIRLVSLTGQLYATNPITRQWLCFPPGTLFDPLVLFDPARGIDQLLGSQLDDIVLVGIETYEGRPHYHLQGTMAGPPLHQISYGLLGAGTVAVDLWADVETMQASRIVLVDSATDADDPTTWMMTLSDYNKDVEIIAPVECSS